MNPRIRIGELEKRQFQLLYLQHRQVGLLVDCHHLGAHDPRSRTEDGASRRAARRRQLYLHFERALYDVRVGDDVAARIEDDARAGAPLLCQKRAFFTRLRG